MTDTEFIDAFQKAEDLLAVSKCKEQVVKHLQKTLEAAEAEKREASDQFHAAVYCIVHGCEKIPDSIHHRSKGKRHVNALHNGNIVKWEASVDDYGRYSELRKTQIKVVNLATT